MMVLRSCLFALVAAASLAAQTQVDGLSIPARQTGTTMLHWNAQRVTQGKAWFATHPYTPSLSGLTLYSPWRAILGHHVLTGNSADCAAAYTFWSDATKIPVSFSIASDPARAYGEYEIMTYDWCSDTLTPSQLSVLRSNINAWVTSCMKGSWGNKTMSYNNYYWGYLRNELEWGIASYNEQPAQAQVFLNDVLGSGQRWDSFKADALTYQKSGAPLEGTQYGRYMTWYGMVPFEAAADYGRDLWNETPWFRDNAFYLIYGATDTPMKAPGVTTLVHQMFSYGDDQFWTGPTAGVESPLGGADKGSYNGEFMFEVANRMNPQTAGFAKAWLNTIQPQINQIWTATDISGSVVPTSSSQLPLDYQIPGPQMSFSRSAWGGTAFFARFGGKNISSHYHMDSGTFSLWNNGKFLTRETVGYSNKVAGLAGTGTAAATSTLLHNTIIVNGVGQSVTPTSSATVTRLQSDPAFFYTVGDIGNTYTCSACRLYGAHPDRDNKAVQHIEREFLFIRNIRALIVFDRILTTATTDVATATLACETPWQTIDAMHERCVNGAESMSVANLITPGALRIVNENACTGCTQGQSRLELDAPTGNTMHYSINVLQAENGGISVPVTGVDSAPSTPLAGTFTINVGSNTIVLNKGTTSVGGTLNGVPLRTTVQPEVMTDQGPQWN